jgi:uncharacterized membrane-anchored protein
VPEVTAFFWIIKALTTGMGESTSDFMVHHLVPEIAVVFGGIAFVIALFLQFSTDRYVPWRYWLAVAMVGVFGTMAADVLHVSLGVPYVVSTVFYAIVLAAVTFGLGYFGSGLLFAAVIAVAALGYYRFRMNSILAFWFAYVVTRPLGASFADWLAVSSARGGLGIGTGLVSFVLAALIAALVAYLTMSHEDTPASDRPESERVGQFHNPGVPVRESSA